MRGHANSHLAASNAPALAAVQARRISPLSLAAGESMKVTGASRRSAAPGSQSVGVAAYGDDSCAFQHSSSTRTNRAILGAYPLMHSTKSPCVSGAGRLWLVSRGAQPSQSRSRAVLNHKTTRRRYPHAAPLPVCAILCPHEPSPQQEMRFRHRRICNSRAPMQHRSTRRLTLRST
jgi:hypothetical protein